MAIAPFEQDQILEVVLRRYAASTSTRIRKADGESRRRHVWFDGLMNVPEIIRTMSNGFAAGASVTSVYGDPVTVGAKTVIRWPK